VDRHAAHAPVPELARILGYFAGSAAVPDIEGKQRLLMALSVDTLGVGMFLPLAFYFFTVTTSLPMSGIGLTISCATFAALLLAPVGGVLTDRYGARSMVVTSNLLSAAGYFLYPAVSAYSGMFLCVLLVMMGDRLYFASWPTLIARIARPDQLTGWFSLVQSINAGCSGVGSLLSTLVLATSGAPAVKIIVVANACTSVIAAALTATQDFGSYATSTRPASLSPWLALSNPLFRRLLLAQLLIATAWTIPGTFLPLYLTKTLDLPRWSTTLASATNYLLIFLFQLRVTHYLRHTARIRIIALGVGLLLASLGIMAVAMPLADPGTAATIVAAGVVIYTIGEMLVLPSTYALVSAISSSETRGRYMSLFQMTGVVAFGIGPGMVGWLFEISPLAVLLAVSALTGCGALVIHSSRHIYSLQG
jgi:MFS family permease